MCLQQISPGGDLGRHTPSFHEVPLLVRQNRSFRSQTWCLPTDDPQRSVCFRNTFKADFGDFYCGILKKKIFDYQLVSLRDALQETANLWPGVPSCSLQLPQALGTQQALWIKG